jgi:glycosyltransferase involved in cell wall biosynthesis
MKIAIDVRKWHDYGIGTYVRNLVRHLALIDRESTYFLFCDPTDRDVLRDLAGNFVPVVDRSRGYGLREHVTIPWHAARLGADLLHMPHYVVPLLTKGPAVVTIHDCIHLLFPEYLRSGLALPYARAMMGHAVRRSARVFTVSEASRRDILHFWPRTDPDHVQVVPNAVDEALLAEPSEEQRERVRERYQIRGRYVLYVGNVKPHKNLDRLVRAFARLRRRPEYDDVKLLIIGQDENRYAGLRRTVEAAGVRQDVRLFGFVPDATLAALYRLATVFAFPSLYEGFGLPPLEAMACGTPVVTSRASALPEVVGDAAVLVEPNSVEDIADGLARVLGDDALQADLSRRGKERARQFSWERAARATHAGYLRVLGRPLPAVALPETPA